MTESLVPMHMQQYVVLLEACLHVHDLPSQRVKASLTRFYTEEILQTGIHPGAQGVERRLIDTRPGATTASTNHASM